MPITYSIDRIDTDVEDVAVPHLDQATISYKETVTDASSGQQLARYSIDSGDPLYKTLIEASIQVNPRTAALTAVQRNTLRLRSWSVTDDGIVIPVRRPFEVGLFWNHSGPVEVADLRAAIGNAFALTYNALSTKVPDNVVLNKYLFGTLTELW